MTQEEIENKLNELTDTINSLQSTVNNILESLTDLVETTSELKEDLSSSVSELEAEITTVKTTAAYTKSISSFDDVSFNKRDLYAGDVLYYDGGKWTNYDSNKMTGGGGISIAQLEDLTNVQIDESSLVDGQALVYSVAENKWINKTISNSGSTTSFDVTQMWEELKTKDTTGKKYIDPSHIVGDLAVSSITTTNGAKLTQGNTTLELQDSKDRVYVTSNIVAAEGVAALKEYET